MFAASCWQECTVVLQLKRQLCGAQRPPSHHHWRNLWPPGGLLRVLCYNRFRAGGSGLAGPCLSHFTGACCVYAPGLLSHFGSASVSISLCIWSMLVAWLLVLVLEVRSPAGVHMRAHTHRLRSPLCGWKSHVVLYGGRVP